MIGRKVATYSRRKPFVNVKEAKDNEQDAAVMDSKSPTESFVREDCMLARISSSIRNMDIRLSTPAKSRKSDIRPRLSMAPSAQEMNDLLTCCNQVDGGTPFNSWLETIRCKYPDCEKLGESSFSEVFKFSNREECLAIKIMPLLKPGVASSKADESRSPEPILLSNLLHEIETIQALEGLRAERKYAVPMGHTGFNRRVQCVLVVGEYPSFLLNKWDSWVADFSSYNDRPDHYDPESLHVILVMEFGGIDLEHFVLKSLSQIQSIFLQILSAISLAEEKLMFEHRDLHLGNILIKETHRDDIRLGNYLSIPTGGLLCSIIDCSLARYQTKSHGAQFRDLVREDWLFSGDASESEQYQIYRNMKDLVNGDWEGFHPKSNLLWIAYVGRSLLSKHARFAKKEKERFELLENFVHQLLSFKNCKDAFNSLLKL